MKLRLTIFLVLFVSITGTFAAYTEFYCDATNGNNLWAGSSTSTSPYTKTAGNWTQATRVYTVQDGTNPSSSVSVGDFASVYADGASAPAVYIGRVSAVQNATNGTITMTTAAEAGSPPSNGTGNRTIVVGGVWKGPNAASSFPLNLSGVGNLLNTSSDAIRINLKNNSTYSTTSGVSFSGLKITLQGYSSSVGDGGKATIDSGNNAVITLSMTGSDSLAQDLILVSSASSGNNAAFLVSNTRGVVERCVTHGARGAGFDISGTGQALLECEAYGNNTANGSTAGSKEGFANNNTNNVFVRCYSHDNTGSNADGFGGSAGRGSATYISCISDSNGKAGFSNATNSSTGGPTSYINCDTYNNTGDGISMASGSTVFENYWIENCNFIKNGGKGINNAATSQRVQGFVYNCGYGAGTEANGGGDATLGGLVESGKVTYASNVTPWNAPTTGDFSITLTAAQGVGRGAFTETDGTNTGTVGYPDTGAAQAQIGTAFPTPTATPTVTPTPTTPPETSHTFGG